MRKNCFFGTICGPGPITSLTTRIYLNSIGARWGTALFHPFQHILDVGRGYIADW